jgi:uncharacterized protein YhjY with autotransporter beta-barrel domain
MNDSRRVLWVILFVSLGFHARGQFDFGVSAGLSSQQVDGKTLTFLVTDQEKFNMVTSEARYGIQVGTFALIQFNSLFIMPEATFHNQKFEYLIEDLNSVGETVSVLRTEHLNKMDLSLLIGYKWWFLRMGAGPVARLHLDNVSQLWAHKGFEQEFNTAIWGAQLGLGIDILMFHVDLRYQLDFSSLGNHIKFFGTTSSNSSFPQLLALRVGMSF